MYRELRVGERERFGVVVFEDMTAIQFPTRADAGAWAVRWVFANRGSRATWLRSREHWGDVNGYVLRAATREEREV